MGGELYNTPELFRYLFYSLLNSHREQIGLGLDLFIRQVCDALRHPQKGRNFPHLIDERYPQLAETNARWRKLGKANGINNDPQQEGKEYSLFARKYIGKIDPHAVIGSLCLHIQHLAYLVAYGTSQDWPMMREEYRLIVQLLGQMEPPASDAQLSSILTDGKTILEKTSEHIQSLIPR
ncbi:MAG: hypothetical protein OHK0039_35160 [Bacteroidia bacterium]